MEDQIVQRIAVLRGGPWDGHRTRIEEGDRFVIEHWNRRFVYRRTDLLEQGCLRWDYVPELTSELTGPGDDGP